jgi:hypothetical protein
LKDRVVLRLVAESLGLLAVLELPRAPEAS